MIIIKLNKACQMNHPLGTLVKYSVLIRDLVMKNNSYMKTMMKKMIHVLIKEMKNDPEIEGLLEDEPG